MLPYGLYPEPQFKNAVVPHLRAELSFGYRKKHHCHA